MSGLIITNGFCQSIEDILNNSSPQHQPAEEKQPKKESSSSPGQPATGDENAEPKKLFSLQVGTFKTQDAADEQIIELTEKGYEPYIFQSVNSKGQTIYSVRIGSYDSHQSAAESLRKLQENIETPAMIAHYDSLEIAPEPTSSEAAEPRMAATSENIGESTDAQTDQTYAQAPPASSGGEGEGGPETLQQRINRLESEIDQMKKAADVRKDLQMTEEEAREEEEDILEAAGREYTLTKSGNIKFSYGFGYSYWEFNAIKESLRF